MGLHASVHVLMNEAACMRLHTLGHFPLGSLQWVKDNGPWCPDFLASQTSRQGEGEGIHSAPWAPLPSVSQELEQVISKDHFSSNSV